MHLRECGCLKWLARERGFCREDHSSLMRQEVEAGMGMPQVPWKVLLFMRVFGGLVEYRYYV